MRTYVLDPGAKAPLYEQLYRAMKEDILSGAIAGGEKLPSKRALAEHLSVSRITVENAYQQLLAEGYVVSRPRSGFYAETLEALPPACAEQIEKVTVEDCPALSAPIILQNAQLFQTELEKILPVFQQRKCYFREESASLLKALLIRLARMAMLTDIPGNAMADRLIQYIREHCREDLTVEKIAAHFNYHAGHINRIMRRATGTTIHSYLIRCRMDAAKTLLLSTDMTVSQVAEEVGIESEAYFCNSFKKLTGITPKEYRRRAKNQ